MTREEAITTLKEMHDSFDEIHENTNGDLGYEQMTALDIAIKTLTELQKHGRLVDADSLMKYFSVYEYEEWTSAEVSELINNALIIIESEIEE